MDIRPFRPEDAGEAAALIARTLREVNIRDYTEEYIESLIQRLQPQDIAARAAGTHFYGAWEGGRLIGTGGIGPLEGRAEEYGLYHLFVLPEYQGRGVGRAILEALEGDTYGRKARCIEAAASITALPFYLGLGYAPAEGSLKPDEAGLVRLEKRRPGL